ncbi:MAG: S8 family serine peptidase [Eubacteriales bacterium]|nr:S8 family serine peptidase [Eubacteriales bacterium]
MATKRRFSLLALILAFVLLAGIFMTASVFASSNEDNEEYDYIIGYDEGSVRTLMSIGSDIASYGGRIEKHYGSINASKVKMTKRAAEALKNQSGISFVEPDYPVYASSQTVAWGVERVYELEDYPFDSWSVTSGQGIRVAVLDTGIDEAHEDIPMLVGGYNTIGDGSYWGTDQNGHGTHVAGIISAQNNEFGILGVSPAVNLYAVKVLDSKGSGSISTIMDGIQWAMDNDIDIINMSLGTFEYSIALEQICNEAYESGILLIAAAGNSGNALGTGTNISYPALFDSVMAVTASDQMDNRASFSSTGIQAEVMAPGVDILSTVPDDALNSALYVSGIGVSYISKIVEGSGIGAVSAPMVDIGLAANLEEIQGILVEKNITAEDGWIALIDRGALIFSEKVSNAMFYGADGAVIINDSESIFEEEAITLYATEADREKDWIPTIFVSYETGQDIRMNDQHGTMTVGYSNYGNKSGTSMASPHVAAVAAVLWAADPTLSNADIRHVITSTALDLELPQQHQGFGLIQLNSGLALVLNNLEPVEKEPLLLLGFTAESKTYDGNNSAIGCFSDSRNEGDILEFSYDVEFVDSNAGLGKIVNFSNIEISGGLDKNKYILAATTGQAVADIIQALVTGVPESPDIAYGDAVPDYFIEFVGFIEGEGIEDLDQFEYVIDSDYVSGSLAGVYNLTISAITISALNYEFNIAASNTFEVAPKSLNLEGGFTVSDKIFDGTKSAEILENDLTLKGVLEGDEVYITDVAASFITSATSNNIEVRIIDISIDGEDAGNYRLSLDNMPVSYADINAPVTPPPSGGGSSGGGGSGISIPIIADDPAYATIEGSEVMDVGTLMDDESDGKTYTKIILDYKKIEAIIKDLEDANGSRMTISSDKDSSSFEISMTKDTADLLSRNNMELEMLFPIGGHILPMNLLSLEDSIEELGENIRVGRILLNMIIATPEVEDIELINQKLQQKGMSSLAEPVDFSIIVRYGNLMSIIDRFGGYTTKLVPLDKSVDGNQSFTGVVFDKNDAFKHLPSRFVVRDGKSYASIKSMNNSIYTAIRNEVFALNVSNHWSRVAVNDMVSKLVITNPETFNPEENITRGAFADYIAKALGLNGTDTGLRMTFSDVDTSGIFAESIGMAAEYGIIEGYTDGTFKPSNTITRQEAMTMYARAMDLIGLNYIDSQRILNYVDRDQVADWAYEEVSKVLNARVFNGTGATTISPGSTFRYAEAATAIKNLLDRFMEIE